MDSSLIYLFYFILYQKFNLKYHHNIHIHHNDYNYFVNCWILLRIRCLNYYLEHLHIMIIGDLSDSHQHDYQMKWFHWSNYDLVEGVVIIVRRQADILEDKMLCWVFEWICMVECPLFLYTIFENLKFDKIKFDKQNLRDFLT